MVLTQPLWVAENRIGFPYDTRGIFGIAAGSDWHDKQARFCSEAVLEGAEEGAGNYLLNAWAKQWQVTPRDLFISPRIEILSGPAKMLRTFPFETFPDCNKGMISRVFGVPARGGSW